MRGSALPKVVLVALALAGCAEVPPPAPVQTAAAVRGNDPALMEAFFGPGQRRTMSPVIRCPIRCQAPAR